MELTMGVQIAILEIVPTLLIEATISYYQLLGCPREMFLLFVFIIIFYRMGTDYFYYICLKTDISSFKMNTETLKKSE